MLLAEDTDHIATSDLSDLRVLAEAADRHVELITGVNRRERGSVRTRRP